MATKTIVYLYNLFYKISACPSASGSDSLTTTTVVPTSVSNLPGTSTQQFITQQQPPTVCTVAQPSCNHVAAAPHCQMSCSPHQQLAVQQQQQQLQQQQSTHQVQAATQTQQATQTVNGETKKTSKGNGDGKGFSKKNRVLRHQNQTQTNFQQNQSYQIDHNSGEISLGGQ